MRGTRCVAVLRCGSRCTRPSSSRHCPVHRGWTFGDVRRRSQPESTTRKTEFTTHKTDFTTRKGEPTTRNGAPTTHKGEPTTHETDFTTRTGEPMGGSVPTMSVKALLVAQLPSTGDACLDCSLLQHLEWVAPDDQLVLLRGVRNTAAVTKPIMRSLLLKYHPDKRQTVTRDYPHGLQAVMLWRKAYPQLWSAAPRS
jgi:hypothetical protein